MKHGPIALIDEKTPSVFLAPRDSLYDKTFSNLEEIKARKGPVIAIATEGDEQIARKADEVIYLPPTLEPIFPLLSTIPLQLLASYRRRARPSVPAECPRPAPAAPPADAPSPYNRPASRSRVS